MRYEPLTLARRKNNSQGAAALAAALLIAAAGRASPQEPARAIEEIIVTAQKTEQNLRDVPISVTAIGGDLVRDSGLNDLSG